MKTQRRWTLGIVTLFLGMVTLTSIGRSQIQPNRPTFFEDGYRRMEQEIQQLETPSTQPNNSLLTIESEEFKWQRLLSRDGQFSIWIPTGISTTETKEIKTKTGDLTFEVLTTNQPNSRFIVAYTNHRSYASVEEAESVFAEIRDFMVNDTGFQIASDRALTIEQFPARLLSLKTPEEVIFFQLSWRQDKIYILGVSQQKSVNLSQAANQFFNSFQILSESS